MKIGLMIARSRAWNAPTNVRSSVFRRPGMIEFAYAKNTPATSPMVIVAAISTASRNTSTSLPPKQDVQDSPREPQDAPRPRTRASSGDPSAACRLAEPLPQAGPSHGCCKRSVVVARRGGGWWRGSGQWTERVAGTPSTGTKAQLGGAVSSNLRPVGAGCLPAGGSRWMYRQFATDHAVIRPTDDHAVGPVAHPAGLDRRALP
jgi:hypothetical protein